MSFFFFQAEDGIRDLYVTGVQTCALPIWYRPPDGTYLAWLDCTAMGLAGSPGDLIGDRAKVTVIDGPAFGPGGEGSVRFNFATPQPVLGEMVGRIAAALTEP